MPGISPPPQHPSHTTLALTCSAYSRVRRVGSPTLCCATCASPPTAAPPLTHHPGPDLQRVQPSAQRGQPLRLCLQRRQPVLQRLPLLHLCLQLLHLDAHLVHQQHLQAGHSRTSANKQRSGLLCWAVCRWPITCQHAYLPALYPALLAPPCSCNPRNCAQQDMPLLHLPLQSWLNLRLQQCNNAPPDHRATIISLP